MLKEILLTLDFNRGHFEDFIQYCREKFVNNAVELRNVQKIEKEYDGQQAIRWYTYQSFLYSMLNRALRTMEADLIVNMGFFVQDLHKHITALHTEQYGGRDHLNSFIVYRGQGLSQIDFNQLKTTEGGLLAFNNFLSTSLKREVSLKFVKHTVKQFRLIGVLFVIRIQPSLSTTPFASVRDVSYYKAEEEILFSMHSVFRIESAQQIDQSGLLWEVNLTLTDQNDPQLHALMENMRGNNEPQDGWFGLANLMITVAQFDKAKQMFEMMLNQTTDESQRGNIFQRLGCVMHSQKSNERALSYYEKALEILPKTLPANHPSLVTSYNNIGLVYSNMGEYSEALSYHEKALEMLQKTLPANHPSLATSHNNIGLLYSNMGEYSKALSYYEKALEIRQKTLPANHPDSATSYNNIGGVYDNMGEYSKALSYYEKALEILQKTLPANHPDLASFYNNTGLVCYKMGEKCKALSYCEHASKIVQSSLASSDPRRQQIQKVYVSIKNTL